MSSSGAHHGQPAVRSGEPINFLLKLGEEQGRNPQLTLRRVTSPAALRMLHKLSSNGHTHCWYQDKDYYIKQLPAAEQVRALDLRRRLQKSGLAQQIAGGPGMLSDHTQAMWPVLRAYYGLFTPRRMEDRVLQLAQFLEYYLAPEKRLPLWIQVPAWIPLLLLLLVFLTLQFLGQHYAHIAFWGMWFWPFQMAMQSGYLFTNKRVVHQTELYFYLLESFADPPEPAPLAALPAAEAATSAAAETQRPEPINHITRQTQ